MLQEFSTNISNTDVEKSYVRIRENSVAVKSTSSGLFKSRLTFQVTAAPIIWSFEFNNSLNCLHIFHPLSFFSCLTRPLLLTHVELVLKVRPVRFR